MNEHDESLAEAYNLPKSSLPQKKVTKVSHFPGGYKFPATLFLGRIVKVVLFKLLGCSPFTVTPHRNFQVNRTSGRKHHQQKNSGTRNKDLDILCLCAFS